MRTEKRSTLREGSERIYAAHLVARERKNLEACEQARSLSEAPSCLFPLPDSSLQPPPPSNACHLRHRFARLNLLGLTLLGVLVVHLYHALVLRVRRTSC
eukprot:1964672-Rhodomonas_salina.3